MKNGIKLELPADVAGKQPVVMFDGECSLCSSTVRFLLRYNRSGNLNFLPLQSETGSEIIRLAGNTLRQSNTVILLQDDQFYVYSTAALKIAAHLDSPLLLLKYLEVVPAVLRDCIYRFIAKNRYKWFGKEPLCQVDYQADAKRFLS